MNSFAIAFALLLVTAMPATWVTSVPSNNFTSSIIGNLTDSLPANVTSLIEETPSLLDDDTEDNGGGDETLDTGSPFPDEGSRAGSVVINEVELNPQGMDAGSEWIEIYNPSDEDIDIGGFEITTSFKTVTIQLPSDTVIKANVTFVIELEGEGQVLSNIAESLRLADTNGETIDSTPSLVDLADSDWTWQRMPDGGNKWEFAINTRGYLNDPEGQTSATRSVRPDSVTCQGTAGCVEGIVTRIVDGDTLYVRVNGTVYKVDLALTKAPERGEENFMESTSFTRDLCLGNTVLVDQDDKLLTTTTSVIAVVYCGSTNLNSELLDSGHATLNRDHCNTSEFGAQPWARKHGC
ncbi:MAG TPA: lamin tail domain-containing protein [Nitrososphaera sp.]|nr:lamin tail domain-containing protein [Nitrososphaera sp.]